MVVAGTRQTDKTTLVRQVLAESDRPKRYLSVDDPDPAALPLDSGPEKNIIAFPGGDTVPFADERQVVTGASWGTGLQGNQPFGTGLRSGDRRDSEDPETDLKRSRDCGMRSGFRKTPFI